MNSDLTFDYMDIKDDVYDYYIESYNSNEGDSALAIAEASVYFLMDESLIENIINSVIRGETEDA